MIFNSLTFIVFFVFVTVVYYTMTNWQHKKVFLLLMSYVFYGAWNPPFVALLWLSTVIDWWAAKKIEDTDNKNVKKSFLLISLVSNLGLLAFFKYGNFILENFRWTAGLAGFAPDIEHMDIILPVGISFYTFQTLSYTIDVYRGDMKRAQSFTDFGLYVTFFPQLVAGPIVRAIDYVPQCLEPKKPTMNQFCWGLYLVTLGLFQKVVLADVFLSSAADTVFNAKILTLNPLDAWAGVLAFSGQIFFDFAGYSTCAIGVSICLGFFLPDNFRFPYASLGFSDFWRRWHISLSSWLRDYLYISVGGNRYGIPRRMMNLLFTMLVGGLWHGASWVFVIWGALHGSYLVIEHFLKHQFEDVDITVNIFGRTFVRLLTFVIVVWTFIPFRAKDVPTAKLIFLSVLGAFPDGAALLPSIEIIKVSVVMLSLLAFHWYLSETHLEYMVEKVPAPLVVGFWSFMLFILTISQGGSSAFIYFQF